MQADNHFKTMNTLIIDDDLLLRKLLSHLLLEAGHNVSIAHNGQEAINLIEKNKNFDLIFVDLMMPVLTGPSFLMLLKKHFPAKLPLIVMISAVREGEAFLKKLGVNYDYFVQKPLDLEKLRQLVDTIHQSKQQQS